MASVGRRCYFAVLSLAADTTTSETEAAAGNLRILVEQIESGLRQGPHVDGIIFMVPRSLEKLGDELRKLGFAGEHGFAVFWKHLGLFRDTGSVDSAVKPS
jgi:hypothetical protein